MATIYGGQDHAAKSFFEGLGLGQYYPQRLTILDGLCLRKRTLHEVSSSDAKEISWLVLQKIMSFDVQSTKSLFKLPDANFDNDFDEEFNDDSNDGKENSDNFGYHPMDVILALFLCADDFLRQDMMVKLSSCQLAIPLVLRDPFTQELALPLWALSSIVKSWRTVDSNGKTLNFEHQLTKFEMPIVSIIRLGNHEVSKSKLLNNVISSINQQDYFFHRDCNGGSFKRFVGNGVIDICWYLPSGGKEDSFPGPIAFVNLHGDACDSMNEKQVDFLSKISTLCLVLAPGSVLNAESISVLKKFINFTLLIKGKKPTNLEAEFSRKVHAISLNRNEYEIKMRLRKEIITRAAVFSPEIPEKAIHHLVDNFAHKCQIEVDSKSKFFSDGKALASVSFTKIHCEPKFKAKNLPLQGIDLWQEWAKHDKEQNRHVERGSKDIQQYESEIAERKHYIRAMQRNHLTNLSPIMTLFVENLKSYDFNTINYYLHCLKLYLNNLSRDDVSQIYPQYEETQNKLRHTFQNAGYDTDVTSYELRKETEKLKYELRDKLNDFTFVEHLLRETGQIYETSLESETPKNIEECFSHLPAAVAKLVISGYPFEIMDGDAAHVPIKWVQAVLKEVIELLGDPRIFVLSVLGLQCTGKSTLLNTMFGFHFNVSGFGRCTRGAYMQLIPISENLRRDIECDYILAIDTKGLRAPELVSIQSLYAHVCDNELATFVIGLANNTLINIYGTVAGDMHDILSTSVHAFIRMRCDFKPSCQFVYQNAGAGNKSGIGHDKFIQKLDEMTHHAAAEEGCLHQFQRFRDVIKFDDQSDVHYFECLWVGNPPMAPVNPGYSASAQSLKLHIIKQIQDTKCSRLSSFSHKLTDLWDALLVENFFTLF